MERTLRRMARKRGLCAVQKARLARIHTVKTQYCSAFIHSKMKAQQRLLALEVGSTDQRLEAFNDEDLFQLQHHHLLSCLERTTVCSPLSLSLSLCLCVSLCLSDCHRQSFHRAKVSDANSFYHAVVVTYAK